MGHRGTLCGAPATTFLYAVFGLGVIVAPTLGQMPVRERSPNQSTRFPPLPDMIQRRQAHDLRKARVGMLTKLAHVATDAEIVPSSAPAKRLGPTVAKRGAGASKKGATVPSSLADSNIIVPVDFEEQASASTKLKQAITQAADKDSIPNDADLGPIDPPKGDAPPVPGLPDQLPAEAPNTKKPGTPTLSKKSKPLTLTEQEIEFATRRAEEELERITADSPAKPRPSMVAPSMVKETSIRPPSLRKDMKPEEPTTPSDELTLPKEEESAAENESIPRPLPELEAELTATQVTDAEIAASRKQLEDALRQVSATAEPAKEVPAAGEPAQEASPEPTNDIEAARKELEALTGHKNPSDSEPATAKSSDFTVDEAKEELAKIVKQKKVPIAAPVPTPNADKPEEAKPNAPVSAPKAKVEPPKGLSTQKTPPARAAGADVAILLADILKKGPPKKPTEAVPLTDPTATTGTDPKSPPPPAGLSFAREVLKEGVELPPPPPMPAPIAKKDPPKSSPVPPAVTALPPTKKDPSSAVVNAGPKPLPQLDLAKLDAELPTPPVSKPASAPPRVVAEKAPPTPAPTPEIKPLPQKKWTKPNSPLVMGKPTPAQSQPTSAQEPTKVEEAMPTLAALPIPKERTLPPVQSPALKVEKTLPTITEDPPLRAIATPAPMKKAPVAKPAPVATPAPRVVVQAQQPPVHSPPVAAAPVEHSGKFDQKEARRLALLLASETESTQKRQALVHLAQMQYWYRASGAVDAVTHVAQSEIDSETRLSAIELLGKVPSTMADATAALRAISSSKTDASVRRAAQAVLAGRMDSPTRGMLR